MARVFKTKSFSKTARKAAITDEELCAAIVEAMAGQAVDLGGGVLKKRLNDNEHRSIILMKGGEVWVYQFMFAKKDMENIKSNELKAFKALADVYAILTTEQLDDMVKAKEFVEICNDEDE